VIVAWWMGAALAATGWRADVQASMAACGQEPAPCAAADAIVLRHTRAGHLMAQDDRLDDPAIVGPLLDRLLRETDAAVRVGLADAFVETMEAHPGTSWDAAWIELASTDPQADVRALLVNGMRRAPLAVAGPGLRAALASADPGTRADAVATMGGHAAAAGFAPELLSSLDDGDANVRRMAARALRWLGDPAHRGALAAHADDPDAAVRAEIAKALDY